MLCDFCKILAVGNAFASVHVCVLLCLVSVDLCVRALPLRTCTYMFVFKLGVRVPTTDDCVSLICGTSTDITNSGLQIV